MCSNCPDGSGSPSAGATSADECAPCETGWASSGGDPCTECPGLSTTDDQSLCACPTGTSIWVAATGTGHPEAFECTGYDQLAGYDQHDVCVGDGQVVRLRWKHPSGFPHYPTSPPFNTEGQVVGRCARCMLVRNALGPSPNPIFLCRLELKYGGPGEGWSATGREGTSYDGADLPSHWLIEDTWYPVADQLETFGEAEATVACQQLGDEIGYSLVGASAVRWENTYQDAWSGDQTSLSMRCDGTETSVDSCTYKFEPYIVYDWDAAVQQFSMNVGVACTFQEQTHTCTACAPGKSKNTTSFDACSPCAAGRYSIGGSATCQACEAGKVGAPNSTHSPHPH